MDVIVVVAIAVNVVYIVSGPTISNYIVFFLYIKWHFTRAQTNPRRYDLGNFSRLIRFCFQTFM